MAKHYDLQPWLEYFGMLRSYEEKGFLEVLPAKGEAYITRPALYSLSDRCSTLEQLANAVPDIVKRLRAYVGWRSQQGSGFLKRPFALHVVKEKEPFDLLYTILLTRRRRWFSPWRKSDSIEIIDYGTEQK